MNVSFNFFFLETKAFRGGIDLLYRIAKQILGGGFMIPRVRNEDIKFY